MSENLKRLAGIISAVSNIHQVPRIESMEAGYILDLAKIQEEHEKRLLALEEAATQPAKRKGRDPDQLVTRG